MKLKKAVEQNGSREYLFEHAVNDGFVNNAAAIRVDSEGRVLAVRLNSARFGTAAWETGRGLVECRAWESEEDLEKLSYISKHFQTALVGPAKGPEFAREILDDCIAASTNRSLVRLLLEFCEAGHEYVFDKAAYDTVEAEFVPSIHVRDAETRARIALEQKSRMDAAAAAKADAQAQEEEKAKELEAKAASTEADSTPPDEGRKNKTERRAAYVMAAIFLVSIAVLFGFWLHGKINKPESVPKKHEAPVSPPPAPEVKVNCCALGGIESESAALLAICREEGRVLLYLRILDDGKFCSAIENTVLRDERGGVFKPDAQKEIAHCKQGGFKKYEAGHLFSWVYKAGAFAGKKITLSELPVPEVGDSSVNNPLQYWEWKNVDVSHCGFK